MQADTNNPLSIDPRVDDYVRGKMSNDDALDFEAEYLEKPELLEQVELADRLREGLRENFGDNLDKSHSGNKQETTSTNQQDPSKPFNLFKYLAVPQTVWGAIAAALVLYPALMFNNDNQPRVDTAVYLLNQSITRSSEENTKPENIVLDKTAKKLILGFKTPSTLGIPQRYRLNIYDYKNTLLWKGEDLVPNHALVIYLDMNRSFLRPGSYHYSLEKSLDNSIINKGSFSIESD